MALYIDFVLGEVRRRLTSSFRDTHHVGPERVADFGTIMDEVLLNTGRVPAKR